MEREKNIRMKLEYKETEVTAKYVIKFWAPVDFFASALTLNPE